MPPLEDTSAKALSGMGPNQISRKGATGQDDILEQVSAIRLQESKGFVVEPKTSFKFPVSLSPIGYKEGLTDGSFDQELAGVGVRSVNIIKLSLLKIYAFGLYVRPDRLRAALGEKYGGLPPEDFKNKPSFFEDILSHELDMTMRLIVHHKRVRIGLVKSSFETSLKNRLRKAKCEDDDGLHAFLSYFTEDLSLPAGTVIDFHWQPGGRFHTKVGDQFMGTILSLNFCRAFFDLYIGEPAVCNKGKQDIGLKLGKMFRESN